LSIAQAEARFVEYGSVAIGAHRMQRGVCHGLLLKIDLCLTVVA